MLLVSWFPRNRKKFSGYLLLIFFDRDTLFYRRIINILFLSSENLYPHSLLEKDNLILEENHRIRKCAVNRNIVRECHLKLEKLYNFTAYLYRSRYFNQRWLVRYYFLTFLNQNSDSLIKYFILFYSDSWRFMNFPGF